MESNESKQLDAATLAIWYGEFSPRIGAFLYGLLREFQLAEEALQNTFTKALSEGGSVRSGSEKAWLFQVAFHEAMQIRRRQEVQHRAYAKLEATATSRQNSQPVDRLLTEETIRNVQQAIEGLPDSLREIVNRRIYQEQTFQQISEELSLPLSTVQSRMRSALSLLQDRLRQHDQSVSKPTADAD